MHITASVFINDDESGLHHDYEVWLEKLAPHEPIHQYRHNDTGEDNADAHMKRQIMGREVTVAITNGQLDFGPWEQIFYGEFDGHRRKRVLVKIIGTSTAYHLALMGWTDIVLLETLAGHAGIAIGNSSAQEKNERPGNSQAGWCGRRGPPLRNCDQSCAGSFASGP